MAYKIKNTEIEFARQVTQETLIAYNKNESKRLNLPESRPYAEMIVSTDDNKKIYCQRIYEGDYIVRLKGCEFNSIVMPKEVFESLFDKVED